ncbi:Protein M3 [Ceratobasidium sp. UAMH 11750]|nr:Protein M3 [Ceratobasidium sp. UAMH 11750]
MPQAALFPLGGHRLIARDFADVNTPADVDDTPQSAISRVCSCWSSRRVPHETTPDADLEKAGCQPTIGEKGSNVPLHNPQSPAKNICSSHREVPTDRTEHPKRDSSNSTDPGDGTVVSNLPILNKTPSLTSSNETPSPIEPRDSRFRRATASTWRFLVALATPPTISIVVGITVAMIPTLKALFVPSPSDSHPHIGTAPDGLPPLHVIFDTATFIGGGSIPLGLICLGSALARLEVPKPFSRAPLNAIVALSILKARRPIIRSFVVPASSCMRRWL